ncbi:hypothetical protein M231_03099 [Tremella mesenterica]|uniref:Uncharacterized protein n=2 Tax=Tremella mesenterica TaxID=5217 RepID=A0A4V1M496_TREME|nr:hypothetical protein M231_03099 [Tremella mesenterica]
MPPDLSHLSTRRHDAVCQPVQYCQIDPGYRVHELDKQAEGGKILYRVDGSKLISRHWTRIGFRATNMWAADEILRQIKASGIPTEGRILTSEDVNDISTLHEGTNHPTFHCTNGWADYNPHQVEDRSSPSISSFSLFHDAIYYAVSQALWYDIDVNISVISTSGLVVLDAYSLISNPGPGHSNWSSHCDDFRRQRARNFSFAQRELLVIGSIPYRNVLLRIPVEKDLIGICLPSEYWKIDNDPTEPYHENLLWELVYRRQHTMRSSRELVECRRIEDDAKRRQHYVMIDDKALRASKDGSDAQSTTVSSSSLSVRIDQEENDLTLALKKLSV